jgi:hypothetical protein
MSFTALESTDFVVSSDSVTAPAWTTNIPTLSQFFTASISASARLQQSAYYLNVYQSPTSSVGSTVQFSLAFGHSKGSGSIYYNQLVVGASPTMTTYKQFKNLIYGAQATANMGFNFGGFNTNSDDVYIINVDRNCYKESLFPGTFNLTLSGSGGFIKLCDNSNNVTTETYLDCGRAFDIVSGSYGSATTTNNGSGKNGYTVSGSYGLFLPDIGCIVLNPAALALPFASGGIGLNPYTASNPTSNTALLYSSPNNTNLFNAISGGANFQLNSEETVSSNYAFVRVKNADYNYSSNPTFVSGSGDLVYSSLVNNPQVYMTTIGFYNTNRDLVAVAKMSKPLVKDFTKEALVTVKLDW